MIEPEVAAGRVRRFHTIPDLDHGRIYASHREGGLTAPVDAMLKSIRGPLADIDYLETDVVV